MLRFAQPLIFALPALCDTAGTSVMYLGLTMTYASVFQMLRGSVVVFTGILSVAVLNRRLRGFHWIGMALVCVGALVVGSSSLVSSPTDDQATPTTVVPRNPVLGNALIVCAQMIVAVQMVVEEKLLAKYRVHALEAVGWEGVFGAIYCSCLLVVYYFVPFGGDRCNGHVCVDNTLHALQEIARSPYLAGAVAGNVLSIAFFNFFGVSVTQSMSATHRMVLDSLRTMVIWMVSLALQWQQFNYLQVVGFAVLLSGTLVYNEVAPLNCLCACGSGGAGDGSDWPEALHDEPHLQEEEERLLGADFGH